MATVYAVRIHLPNPPLEGDQIIKVFHNRQDADDFSLLCQKEINVLFPEEGKDMIYRGFEVKLDLPYTWVSGPYEIG